MAKSTYRYCALVSILAFLSLFSSGWNNELIAQSRRHALIDVCTSQLGVTEQGGNNRGPQVEEYLGATGTPPGYAWCASFVKWCFDQAGIQAEGNAWSPSWFPTGKTIYHRGTNTSIHGVQAGDVFGIYFQSLKRVGHVGFIQEVQDKYFVTVEGNTNDGGSREGDGVYKRYRPHYSIYKVANHID